MKIAVCLKAVPGRDSRYRITPQQRWIDESQVTFEISECDEYALEEALKLKDRLGCEVTVVTAGSPQAEKAVRKALAMGADRGLQIDDPGRLLSSPSILASALAQGVAPEGFDLILTGTQSDDLGCGQTGVMLAELLGVPHATLVMEIQVDEAAGKAAVLREMESGWFQRVELPLPAVLTVQAGTSPVRYASLKGIMQARQKPLRRIPLDALALDPASFPAIELERLYEPVSERRAEIIPGDPETAVGVLIERLRKEIRVL
jgi:electron transfer flavoprotein beta subunit